MSVCAFDYILDTIGIVCGSSTLMLLNLFALFDVWCELANFLKLLFLFVALVMDAVLDLVAPDLISLEEGRPITILV